MYEQAQSEHHWLHRMIGEWRYETECDLGPDKPPMKMTGKETVRSLGGLWTIADGIGNTPGGGEFVSQMTLGFDPKKRRFVGTYVASMMTHLWPYDGELNVENNILTLASEGPSCSGDGTTAKYFDIIEIIDNNERTLTSKTTDAEGNWRQFMKARYFRV